MSHYSVLHFLLGVHIISFGNNIHVHLVSIKDLPNIIDGTKLVIVLSFTFAGCPHNLFCVHAVGQTSLMVPNLSLYCPPVLLDNLDESASKEDGMLLTLNLSLPVRLGALRHSVVGGTECSRIDDDPEVSVTP
ncbi:hypothetical protein CEXT_512791 [Caerostris extrusa]|uniref:Uncharacterized protein n=1 Tax=Caerostris extrusa TaxID=172846 RepID=A0AAV4MP73_CAEEX|nr:hypothetical protein CEXT_512791 [Caerostris extrusa]